LPESSLISAVRISHSISSNGAMTFWLKTRVNLRPLPAAFLNVRRAESPTGMRPFAALEAGARRVDLSFNIRQIWSGE
jgi:hypothetical protein